MPRGGQNRIPAVDLLAEIRRLAGELGDTPRLKDMREVGAYGVRPYYRAFGSWNAAVEEAGLDINRPSPDELKETRRVEVSCAVCETEFSVTRSKYESQDQFCCSVPCENRRRETVYSGKGNPRWNRIGVACSACGGTIHRARWNVESREHFYCSDCWGDTDVEIDCEQCGETKHVKRVYGNQRFCSYSCLASSRTGEDHPRWTGGYDGYYGPNWPEQRRRARDRDNHECQRCGVHEDDLDRQLEVHHIEPFRSFVDGDSTDYDAANALSNLVSLCSSCHLKEEWEQNPERKRCH